MKNTKPFSDIKIFTSFLFLSFLFSILIRLIWVYQFQDASGFFWNDQLMINTNDGYYFAEGARDILAGSHQANDLSPVFQPLSQLTAVLAWLLPFSFESIILYMPAFFGSLLVVPVLLMAFSIKEKTMGLIAALMSGIVWSYYNRTMVGYYDTDMLTIVLPTLIVSSMIFAVTHQRNRYLIIIPLAIMANQWWYHASEAINLGLFGMMFLYTLVFERKNSYFYKVLLFMALALVSTYFIVKLALIVAIFLWFHFKDIKDLRIVLILLVIAALGIVFTGGFNPVFHQLQSYVFRSETMQGEAVALHFFNVAQTVREAGKIPFDTFANRISGHTIIFLLSIVGYALLLFRHRVMLLTLPLVGLGFMAYIGGLRFTVYAVPIMALSIAYLITQAGNYIQDARTKILFLLVATIGILAPNISHVLGYRVPTVFTKDEVTILDQLKKISSREDYVTTWWDYGYPIRYYSDVKTLVDGGKHSGDVNFPVSFSLSRSAVASANMARLDVEYSEMAFNNNRQGPYLQMMMEDYNISDPDDFLELLAIGDLGLPAKTRDVYYYLPLRMLDIFPTVMLFSNIDLKSGEKSPAPFFYQSSQAQQTKNILDLGRGIQVDLQKGVVDISNQQVKMKMFVSAEYDNNQKLHVTTNKVHEDGGIYVVYMKSYNRFLVMDQTMYDSTFIQLFVLEQYDKSLFEEVIMTPFAKVYRLRI